MQIRIASIALLAAGAWNGGPDHTPLAPRTTVEFTQGVQDASGSVPLLTNRPTWIRLSVVTPLPQRVLVRGELTVEKEGTGLVIHLPSRGSAFADPVASADPAAARASANGTLNFVVPIAFVATPGWLKVSNLVVYDDATLSKVACDVCGSGDLARKEVISGPTLRVRVIGLRYYYYATPDDEAPRVAHLSERDTLLLKSWLWRAFPISQLEFSSRVVPAPHPQDLEQKPFDCRLVNAWFTGFRNTEKDWDRRTHYYALIPQNGEQLQSGSGMSGCAGIVDVVPTHPGEQVVASGPAGKVFWRWPSDRDGTFADQYGGHELGHTLGLKHVATPDRPDHTCGGELGADTTYPYHPGGLLSSPSDAVDGFDVGADNDALLPPGPLSGLEWHDVMSYCDKEWVSAWTYKKLLAWLLAEDALPGTGLIVDAAAPLGQGLAGATGAGASSGAPGRPPTDEAIGDRADSVFTVIGYVNFTKRLGQITYLAKESGRAAAAGDSSSRVIVRVISKDNTLRDDYRVRVIFQTAESADMDSVALLDVRVPAPSGTNAVALLLDGTKMDLRWVSAPPAPVERQQVVAGAPGDQTSYVIRWTRAKDEDPAGVVRYTVQLRTDPGARWETIAYGVRSPSLTIERAWIKTPETTHVRIIANDGFNSVVSEFSLLDTGTSPPP